MRCGSKVTLGQGFKLHNIDYVLLLVNITTE
ncbi:hypothetical protein N483_00505 [Pseudoalteromonas luteoviolacea NCIMB 1944]|nr:hypothetical protein N483_00505 [Pseudoalteromonas luteoviolacea NCIMB 1944]